VWIKHTIRLVCCHSLAACFSVYIATKEKPTVFDPVACCVYLFSFTFFILTQTWKIVVYKLASCAQIFFIYLYIRIASSGVQRFSLIARSDTCIYVWCLPYIHTYTCKLYLFTRLASTTLQADFHEGVSIATASGNKIRNRNRTDVSAVRSKRFILLLWENKNSG
jgi:hypothetical protein